MKKNLLFLKLLSITVLLNVSCRLPSDQSPQNYKTAYINKDNGCDSFIITVVGTRKLLTHDPISTLKQKMYIDSEKFEIPRREGFINGSEIRNRTGSYPIIKGGITISNDSLKIDLYYNDFDDKKIYSGIWNGSYVLQWR